MGITPTTSSSPSMEACENSQTEHRAITVQSAESPVLDGFVCVPLNSVVIQHGQLIALGRLDISGGIGT